MESRGGQKYVKRARAIFLKLELSHYFVKSIVLISADKNLNSRSANLPNPTPRSCQTWHTNLLKVEGVVEVQGVVVVFLVWPRKCWEDWWGEERNLQILPILEILQLHMQVLVKALQQWFLQLLHQVWSCLSFSESESGGDHGKQVKVKAKSNAKETWKWK